MDHLSATDELFFDRAGLDRVRLEKLVGDSLQGADDGELFLEYCQSESIAFDDGKVKSASYDTLQGFGLRAVSGEATGYAHSSELSESAIKRAAQTVRAVTAGHSGELSDGPAHPNQNLYSDANPLGELDFDSKVKLLADIDDYARSLDDKVSQVMASLSGEWQAVQIIRPDGARTADIRPLVRLNVSVVVADGDKMESGGQGTGGRTGYQSYFEPAAWQAQTEEAFRQAMINLDSEQAPAGEMTVVLGPGWPGILLHEAIGHGLEGDFNRKKTS
ncbi:MAG TPA: metalloprotease TldD, partial [Rhodospirillaceae bacterium]|nr:metalloprotease TldD [Rhodospirillaceae bacterium]